MSENIEQHPVPKTEMQEKVQKEIALGAIRSAIVKTSDDEEDMLMLPLFLGKIGEQHGIIYKTAVAFTAWRNADKAENAGRNKDVSQDRTAAALEVTYKNLVEEHFPDIPEEELFPMLINYINFIYKYTDRLLLGDDNEEIRDLDTINTIKGKVIDGEQKYLPIFAAVPPSDDKKLGVRARMRRNLRRAQGEGDTFNIILNNSMIFMRVEIPTPPDLIRLINSIGIKLQQYGERYAITSIHLERGGIAQILVDFVLDRLKYHSVKDVDDHYELKRYILANDINPIVQALLCITSPKGVSYRTYCLANKCKHNEVKIIDPTSMILEVDGAMPEDRRKVMYEVVNEGRRLSREELTKWKPVYTGPDGKPLDNTVDMGEAGKLIIDIPYLDDYFATFNRMTTRINPELRQLAMDYPNFKEYQVKRKEWLAGMRGSEFVQWFSATQVDPIPGEESEGYRIERSEDPVEFEEGLLDIFSVDPDLYIQALKKVLQLIPRMTYTYIGIRNDQCPSCNQTAEGIETEYLKGFTPIDPIMNFFDRTRMMIGMWTTEASFTEENLS